jgi:hypothetical protein
MISILVKQLYKYIDPLHKCTHHMQIHAKPHNDTMKRWVHLVNTSFVFTHTREA